ncbi:ABC transporter permease [Streptomyces sp. A7024]|uniref:ABC transporter permease n=1 Tax=Streptomyces coryli TaxID=1128680 RepID=A0A6G4U6Y4_9ACTN|nr:ABC transporter permease subunit [Streptomyces coryli]NGN67999.1 ABC transporter permease [Streptomyces coryli]
MTTATVTPPMAAVATSTARFRDLLAAEWLKTWSLRSTPWAYLLTALAAIGFSAGQAYDVIHYWDQRPPSPPAQYIGDGIPVQMIFHTNAATVLAIALTAIGVVSVVGEYGSGQIRTTFAAVPARRSVMAAKAAVLAAITTVFGFVVSFVSFFATQALLDRRDVGVPLDHPGALQAVIGSALLAPVCALIGFAFGAVLRHTGTGMFAGIVLVLLFPFFFSEDHHWSAILNHALPMPAWERLTEAGFNRMSPYPWTPEGAFTVYAAWAVLATAVGVMSVHRRDQ